MTKSKDVIDSSKSFLSWMILNLPVEQDTSPKFRRKGMVMNNEQMKPLTTKFEWLYKFSQPLHVLTLVTSLLVGYVLFPGGPGPPGPRQPPCLLSAFLYVMCFAVHLGTQFWMTFASGLVLFFALPRHEFGRVQQCLFPKYFALNSCLSAALFLLHHHHTPHTTPQTYNLLICFLCELFARIFIVPPLLDSLRERTELEVGAGVGGPGADPPGTLRHCPHYRVVDKRFRRYHAFCACANVISMFCSALHLYFMSTRLRHALT